MAVREGQGLRPLELASEGVVAALGRLNDLVVQRVEVVLHAAKRRLDGAFERRIDLRDRRRHGGHALLDFGGHARERLFDGRRKLVLEKLIEGCLVAGLQRLERGESYLPRKRTVAESAMVAVAR